MRAQKDVIDVEFDDGSVVQVAEGQGAFPAVVTTGNAGMDIFFAEVEGKTQALRTAINSLEVRGEDDQQAARIIAKTAKDLSQRVMAAVKPTKQRCDEIKGIVLQWERKYTMPLTEDKQGSIAATAVRKINSYIEEQERIRREEEARIRDQMERDRQKRMAALAKKMDELAKRAGGEAAELADLEQAIANPEVTVEEAEVMRARINALSARLRASQAALARKEQAIEETSQTANVSVHVEAPKAQGMSTRVEFVPVRVADPMTIIRAIADGRLPVGLIKEFDTALMKKLKNSGIDIPGVVFDQRRVTSIR